METIRKWLNGSRDYTSGVQLYMVHGTDKNLHRLFTAEGYSDFKNKKLLEALQALLAGQGAAVITTALPAGKAALSANKLAQDTNKSAPLANSLVDMQAQKKATTEALRSAPIEPRKEQRRWSEIMDQVERSLFDKWKPLYSELMDLQHQVGTIARQADQDPSLEPEARRMALRILELDKICEQIYSDRNYYLQHNKLPEGPGDLKIDPDPRTWPKKLENNMRYVRDKKLLLEKEQDPDKKRKILSQLQYREQMVAKYKSLLNKE